MKKIIRYFFVIITLLSYSLLSTSSYAITENYSNKNRILDISNNESTFGDPVISYSVIIHNCPNNDIDLFIYSINGIPDSAVVSDSYYSDLKLYNISFDFPSTTEYENFIEIKAVFPDDTLIAEDTVYYCKPNIEIINIIDNENEFEPDPLLFNVVYDSSITLQVHSYAACDVSDNTNKITQYIIELNGETVNYDVDSHTNDTNDITLGINVQFLQGGENIITFWANGDYPHPPDDPNELSDPFSIKLFYLDISLGELVVDTVCHYDDFFRLEGIPPGGRFHGDAIYGETTMFNPILTDTGLTTIYYDYIVDGRTFTTSKNVFILPVSEINLIGDVQVCSYQNEALYHLDNNDYELIKWDTIKGAEKVSYISPDSLLINWGKPGDGYIEVTVLNSAGCYTSESFLIDIGYDPSTIKSYLIVKDQLLVCSDLTANYYYWYSYNSNTKTLDFLRRTDKNRPYHYVDNQINDYDTFYVKTVYDTLHFDCATLSFPGTKASSLNSLYFLKDIIPQNFENHGINVLLSNIPNTYMIEIFNDYQGLYNCRIFSIEGKILFENELDKSGEYLIHKLNLANYKPGIYILHLSNSVTTYTYKLIKN
ncbi:MAG: T9SS type A sorting domain-containing protein [Bacteroidales bacterium]|nr:T9SS type A sorting domain-containing protein [Bacteroidales bacterium]